ncbi:MAG: hypothetical protein JW947_07390 [Sedimentisphaerales bacterium]|nr:hypothetical protein [Sedimentisphaerales bacterium]
MADYIPRNDTDFLAWVNNFVAYADAHPIDLGIGPPVMAPIHTAQTDFDAKLTANISAQQSAQSARQAKDDSRDVLESLIRQLVRQLQASSEVDDTERAALGITVPDRIRTTEAGEAMTRPVGMVDTSQRLRHEIRFVDEATPTSRAKPEGVMGCEIWVKVGDPAPVDPSELSFLATDTASPYVAEYEGANGGKTAHYMLRWVKTGGERGPWSETISATITA